MVLQLVLPRKALVTVVTWTSVGSFPCVQQLVPGHMLWPSELLATYITGVFVVYLGAERQVVSLSMKQNRTASLNTCESSRAASVC